MADSLCLLDTSVIVRYLVGDSPEKQKRAKAVIESEQTLGLTAIAVLEAAFVLHRVYGYPRDRTVDALVELVTRANIVGVGVDRDQVAAKLLLCRSSATVSFGDAMLAAVAVSAGVETAYTFDETLWRAGLRTVAP